jgi:hypothetical protein
MVRYFIVSLTSGVGMLGLPTMRVVHLALCMTLSGNGWFTSTWRCRDRADTIASAPCSRAPYRSAVPLAAPGLLRSSASAALSF